MNAMIIVSILIARMLDEGNQELVRKLSKFLKRFCQTWISVFIAKNCERPASKTLTSGEDWNDSLDGKN